MAFDGSLIKPKATAAGYNIGQLSEQLGVSRQSVSSWMGGQIPRGQHLVRLCSILNVKPADFFAGSGADSVISVPLHRTIRGNKPPTPEMREASKALAEQYLNLFRQAPTAAMLPVIRLQGRNEKDAPNIARELRELAGVNRDSPMDLANAFKLLAGLRVYAVFCTFPEELVRHSYAFFCKIVGQRVVFVNIDTSVLDLIFFLLHETVHAVRDEEPGAISTPDEERFCDAVAEQTQFPDAYMEWVASYIAGLERRNKAVLVNRLKEVSQKHTHSLWGIYYRLQHAGVLSDGLKIAGAAANLCKKFNTVRQALSGKDESPRTYIENLYSLSPNLMRLVEQQVPDCSVRKLGEWLGVDTSIDAQAIMDEIARRKGNP
jgi:transcriptional regulator with XRE-family HTH domain